MTTSYQATELNRIELSGINIDGNTIETTVANSDLILAPEIGEGKVQFNDLHILDNSITNTTNGAANLAVSGNGYIKFNQTSGFGLPTGTNSNRSPSPETGHTRYNNEEGYLEVYTGAAWVDAAASGATVDTDEMNGIMNEYILIFG